MARHFVGKHLTQLSENLVKVTHAKTWLLLSRGESILLSHNGTEPRCKAYGVRPKYHRVAGHIPPP